MRNTARYNPGALMAAILLLAYAAPAFSQSEITPEGWATDLVQESIRKMQQSEHYKDAQELAKRSKSSVDRRQGDLTDFLGAEHPQPDQEDQLMAVVAEYDLFISSSLPLSTLRTYARDIDRLRREEGIAVRMVMRGFVDGMAMIKPTIEFITSIIAINPDASLLDSPDTYAVQIDIDPEKTLSVDQVPALSSKQGSCFVYGDSAICDLISRFKEKKCEEIVGHTEKIVERNAIEELKEAAAKVDTAQIQENIKRNMEASLKNLPGQGILPPCEMAETRKILPEAVLDFDVPDADHPGEILYPKGFRFNPLDYGQVHMKAFMFAGDRPEEVTFVEHWINDSGQMPASFTLLVLGGDYYHLVDQMGRAVYSGIQFANQGWCQATPCLITVAPGNNWIDVQEFAVSR